MDKATIELVEKAARLGRAARAAQDKADRLMMERDDAMLDAVEAGASVYSLRAPLGFASNKSAYVAVQRARARRDASSA